jgi:hypothetical protein
MCSSSRARPSLSQGVDPVVLQLAFGPAQCLEVMDADVNGRWHLFIIRADGEAVARCARAPPRTDPFLGPNPGLRRVSGSGRAAAAAVMRALALALHPAGASCTAAPLTPAAPRCSNPLPFATTTIPAWSTPPKRAPSSLDAKFCPPCLPPTPRTARHTGVAPPKELLAANRAVSPWRLGAAGVNLAKAAALGVREWLPKMPEWPEALGRPLAWEPGPEKRRRLEAEGAARQQQQQQREQDGCGGWSNCARRPACIITSSAVAQPVSGFMLRCWW